MTKQKHAKAIDASSKAEELLPLEQMMSQGGAFTEGAAFAVGDTNQVKASEHQGTEGEDAALLPKLSSGWKWVQLKDLGEIITGTTPPMLAERRLLGEIPLITPAEISGSFNGIEAKRWFLQENRDKAKTVPSDSILMVCIGSGGVGRCSLVDREVGFNQQINAIIVDKSLASPPFVLAAFMSLLFKVQLNSKTNCTSIPILNLKTWGELYVPLTSLVKQQRIGALFKELDHNIELNRGLLEKLTQLKKSMLEQMFPREGESVPRLRFAGFTEPWRVTVLSDIATAVRGGSPRPIEAFLTDSADGLNWIRIGDATSGSKIITSCRDKICREGVSKTRLIPKGSLILSNSMSFGHPYILGIDGCIHDGWLALSGFDQHVNIDYFYYVLTSPWIQQQFTTKAQSSTVKNLDLSRVKSTLLPLPSLDEQQFIGAFLSSFDQRITQQRAKVEKLGQLKKALLEQMFV